MTGCPTHPFPRTRLKNVVSLRQAHEGNGDPRPFIGLENIEPWTGELVKMAYQTADETSLAREGLSLRRTFERGDVLFGKLRPYLAKTWLAEFGGQATTELLVMCPKAIDPRFLRYVCLSREFVDAVDGSTFGTRMPRADWSTIRSVRIPLPSERRQRLISDRLDLEVDRLGAAFAEKRRMLDLLEEKRQAFVRKTVTRGLDLGAALRDSGIAWASKIPKHWAVRKLAHVGAIGNGATPSRSNSAYWANGSIPWLNSAVVNLDEVRESTPIRYRVGVARTTLAIGEARKRVDRHNGPR